MINHYKVCFFSIFFLLSTFIHGQTLFSENSIIVSSQSQIELNLPSNSKNEAKPLRNIILTVLSATSIGLGGYYLDKSNNTYTKYESLQNNIVYSSNSFTNSQLLAIEEERNNLFDMAKSQRNVSSSFFVAGGIVLGIHLSLNSFKLKKAFKFIPPPAR